MASWTSSSRAFDGTNDKLNATSGRKSTNYLGQPRLGTAHAATGWKAAGRLLARGLHGNGRDTPIVRGLRTGVAARDGTTLDAESAGFFSCVSREGTYVLDYQPG